MERIKQYERYLKAERCCCGCTDLRTGVVMWAWIDLVGGILAIFGLFTKSIVASYFELDTVLFSTVCEPIFFSLIQRLNFKAQRYYHSLHSFYVFFFFFK